MLVLLLSETQESLIEQKNIHNFCTKNDLMIKIKQNPSCKSSQKLSHLKIYFLSIRNCIADVEDYKYLDMWIGKSNKKHIESLKRKGRKSSFLTTKTLKEFGQINGILLKDTFETLTLSKI